MGPVGASPPATRAAALDATVVVPSFGRPQLLRACLDALAAQTLRPAEVLVVGRDGDRDTEETVSRAAAGTYAPRLLTVREAGHLPPLALGASEARAEVVSFLDDDAEPWPGWLAALLRHYAGPDVGGVGGLVSQPGAAERSTTTRIGMISWSGRFDALHLERIPTDWHARHVDAVRGTNMSFRRTLLLRYPWDGRLNGGAATDYEVDLCSWVRRQGFRIVYDPEAIVSHHLGPRPEIGRHRSPAAIASYSHNLVYVAGKALSPGRAALAIGQAFLVGSRASHGLATTAADTLAGRRPQLRAEVAPAFRGKLAGLVSLLRHHRDGPLPLDPV
jgi:GT2 family glycosyltransferase